MSTIFSLTGLGWMGSLFGLVGLQRFILDPIGSVTANLTVFVLQVLPLVILAPGVAAGRPTAYFWSSLAATLYFIHGVLQVMNPDTRVIGIPGVVFALGWFVTSVLALKAAPKRGQLRDRDHH